MMLVAAETFPHEVLAVVTKPGRVIAQVIGVLKVGVPIGWVCHRHGTGCRSRSCGDGGGAVPSGDAGDGGYR